MAYAFPSGGSPNYPPATLPSHSIGGGAYAQQAGYPQAATHAPQPSYPLSYSPQPQTAQLAGVPQTMGSPMTAAAAQQPTAGSITYTTSTGPDGRTIYHCFRAVPASYQTPQGVVTGIQWIPAESTGIVPAGAQPANEEFTQSWSRHLTDEDKRGIEKWQREQEKQRRRDEKEAAKRVHEWERERREREKAEEREDRELRKARERDATMRRRSGHFGGGAPAAYDTSPDLARRLEDLALTGSATEGGYAIAARERKVSTGAYPAGANAHGRRSRRGSFNAPPPAAGSDYSDRSADRASGYNKYAPPTGAVTNPYATGAQAMPRPRSRAASPYRAHSPLPLGSRSPNPIEAGLPGAYGAAPTGAGYAPVGIPQSYTGGHERHASHGGRPVSPYAQSSVGPSVDGTYPRGHVLEGQAMPRSPIPGSGFGAMPGPYGASHGAVPGAMPPIQGFGGSTSRPPSRNAMGISVAAPGGYAPQQMAGAGMPPSDPMALPESFHRMPSRAQAYTVFEPFKIQDMDDFLDNMPRLPAILVHHDVLHHDWIKFMTDVSLAWTGRLPLPPGSRLPRPSTAVADLVEMWNQNFFAGRRIEVVLFKGRERRTGPDAGTIDHELPLVDELDVSSSSEEESEDSDLSDPNDARHGYGGYGGGGGAYGQSAQLHEMREARRMRRMERKAEKKRRHKEKKLRRRARAAEKAYSLYVTYLPQSTIRTGPMYAGM